MHVWTPKDSMIAAAITCGITNNLIRERLLQKDKHHCKEPLIYETYIARREVMVNSGNRNRNNNISIHGWNLEMLIPI